jgi:UDP-glucose 4-epimerase
MVTGATGFLGSHLCRRLEQMAVAVHGVSRQPLSTSSPGVYWHQADLGDIAPTLRIVEQIRPDVIFHLASHVTGARDIDAVLLTLHANMVAAVNVMLAATKVGVKRVVLAGSLEESIPSTSPIPVSPYAAAKSAASSYASMFHNLYGTPVTVARIFMAYGPGQRDTSKIVPYVIQCLSRGESPELSSGRRPVDWIYVDDVIDGLLALATQDSAPGGGFDIGSGVLTTVREVVERIVDIMQSSVSPRFGALADRSTELVRAADVVHTRNLLGWSSRISLDAGLRATVDWYKSHSVSDEIPY